MFSLSLHSITCEASLAYTTKTSTPLSVSSRATQRGRPHSKPTQTSSHYGKTSPAHLQLTRKCPLVPYAKSTPRLVPLAPTPSPTRTKRITMSLPAPTENGPRGATEAVSRLSTPNASFQSSTATARSVLRVVPQIQVSTTTFPSSSSSDPSLPSSSAP